MKEKILKILHVIGYVATALLIVLGVAVGVQSCNNNDKTQTQPKAINNIVATYPTEQDYLYLSGQVYEEYKFNDYYTYLLNINDLVDFLDIIQNYDKTIEEMGGVHTTFGYICNIYGITGSGQEVFLTGNALIINLEILFASDIVRFYNIHGLLYELDLSNLSQYIGTKVLFIPTYGTKYDYPVIKDMFKYIESANWRINETSAWHGTFRYIIPPYIVYDEETQPYYINVGFTYQTYYYYAIEYNGIDLIFKGVNTNDLILEKKYSLNGKQTIYYTAGSTYNDNRITLTAYGTKGLEMLQRTFLNYENPNYNAYYYFNEPYLRNVLHRETFTGITTYNYPINFYCEGMFYTNLIINITAFNNNSRELLVRMSYSNNGVIEKVVIYKYFSLDTLTWVDKVDDEDNTEDVLNKDLYGIKIENTILTSENYSLFRTYLYLEYIEMPTYDDGTPYVGNVFILIGDAFGSILPILSISILPGITLGMLIFVPFVITIVLFVVWLFKR